MIRTVTAIGLAGTFIASGTLAACTGAQVGALFGGAAGGALCSGVSPGTNVQIIAIVGCTLVGAWIGANIGAQLDQQSQNLALQAQADALAAPQGTTVGWSHPPSGQSGQVTTVLVAAPQGYQGPCKQYTHIIYIDGQPQAASGVACPNPDGTWTKVS
jgi:surface antigen